MVTQALTELCLFAFIMIDKNNDNDVKIFKKTKTENDTEVIIKLAEDMKRQRLNGNSTKAVKLGKYIADIVFNPDMIYNDEFQKIISKVTVDDIVYKQIKKLVTFSAEATLHQNLDIASLSATAVGAIYDRLMAFSPEFYQEITDAYTFYYIAFRKKDEVPLRIGKRFAMLCGDEKNQEYRDIGKRVFEIICEFVNEKIDKMEFEE